MPLAALAGGLRASVASVVEEAAAGAPAPFRSLLLAAAGSSLDGGDCPLLACGSAAWCGSRADIATPVAVAASLLRAAMNCNSGLQGLPGSGWRDGSTPESDLLLAGDALIPMALEHLAASGGIHSAPLVRDAARVCSSILERRSAGLDAWAQRGEGATAPLLCRRYDEKLAEFASKGGARLAGAPPRLLDDAALIGLRVGRAADLIAEGGPHGSPDASVLLDEALSLVGSGPEGELLRRIIDSVWGSDLFRDL